MESKYTPVRLGELLKHRKEFIKIDDASTYKRVTAKLHAQGIFLRDEVEGLEIKTKKQQLCKSGDFLVAEIDAKVGGFGIVPEELEGAIVSSHYFLFEIDESRLNRQFLNYYLKTDSFQNQINAQGSTNYASIRPTDIFEIEIFLPMPNEQKRIVAILDRVMGRINEVRHLQMETVEYLKRLASSMYSQVFDRVDKKFTSKKLEKVAKISGGGTPYKGQPDYWNGNIPWVSPKDMKSEYLFDSQDHITEFAISNSSILLIPNNSVLMVVRSGILARKIPVAINCVPVTINQDMKSLIPNELLIPEYLKWWVKGNESAILKNVEKGTTVHRIIWNNVKEMYVPLPPPLIQRDIVNYLNALQTKIEELEELHKKIFADVGELIPSFLQKAFAGEL